MDALELADYIDEDHGMPTTAAMLRTQHAAIQQLREALEDTAQTLVWTQWGDCRKFTQRKLLGTPEAVLKTQAALAATEELT